MQGSILNMTRSAASPKGGAALLIISFIRCCQCSNIKYWDSFSFKEQNEPTSTFSLSIWGSVGLWGFRTSNEQHQNDDRQYIRQHRKQLRRDIIHASQHHDQRLCKAKQQASPQRALRRPFSKDDSRQRNKSMTAPPKPANRPERIVQTYLTT